MGILISADPIAIDQACIDLVYASKDPGRDHLVERIESRNGIHTIEYSQPWTKIKKALVMHHIRCITYFVYNRLSFRTHEISKACGRQQL